MAIQSDAYIPYRDDFPADLEGIEQRASENNASLWAIDLPNHVVDGDLVVPPGAVFAMGDNRTRSLDGRYWGFVPRENIVGRPLFVYWSFLTPADQMDKTAFSDRIASWATSLPTSSPRPAGAAPSTSSVECWTS